MTKNQLLWQKSKVWSKLENVTSLSSFCATLSKKLEASNHLPGIYKRFYMAEMTIFVENDQNRVKIATFRLKQDFSHDIQLFFFK